MMTTTPDEAGFRELLSRAVQRRNLTLESLSRRLKQNGTPVSIATLSYWQTGRSLPTRARSIKAVEHLERILELPPGHLVNALPGEGKGRWDPLAVLPRDQQMHAVLDAMGLDLNRHHTPLTVHDSVVVSGDALLQTQTTRMLLRSEEDGLAHLPIVLANTVPGLGAPGLEMVSGCSLGQLKLLEDLSMVVAELVLPNPLHRGDLAMVEYRALWQAVDGPEPGFVRQVPSMVQFLVMEATFEGPPPARAAHHYRPTAGDEEQVGPVAAGRHVQVVLADAPGGIHSLEWSMTNHDELVLEGDPEQ